MPLGVYVHVPWCASRCGYCDFNTYVTEPSGFSAAARAELALLGDRPASTVFFGGGTPTLLPPRELAEVLGAIAREPDAEVTVEANPESVDERSLAELRAAGFTRVSIGMQSSAAHVLAVLERRHTPGRAVQAARWARASGFEHVSLDLIFGTPGETDDDWRASLEAVVAAGPDHVSTYPLDVEPGTRMHAQVAAGRLPAPDPDAQARRYELADELLRAAGFDWYELASWARDEAAQCRHNLGYWRGEDWWGVGPGAHSHVAGVRSWNVKRPAAWAARVLAGRTAAAGHEALTSEQRELERIMLGIRTREGLALGTLDARAAGELVSSGLAFLERDRLVATLRGRMLADAAARVLTGAAATRSERESPAPRPAGARHAGSRGRAARGPRRPRSSPLAPPPR